VGHARAGSTVFQMAATHVHVPTVATLRQECMEVEAQTRQIEDELRVARDQAEQAHRSGAAVLSALEAAMAPLMAELAAERHRAAELQVHELDDGDEAGADSIADLEAEVQHLRLDISHYQEAAEKLQVEERQRANELRRVRVEISEASENLNYEQQRVRHHEVCKQHGFDTVEGWAGLGPSGIGRRTMEVRAEKKMREHAESRANKLTVSVTKLATDTATKQAEIAQLSRRLQHVKGKHAERDKALQKAASTSQLLDHKMEAAAKGAAKMFERYERGSKKNSVSDAGSGSEAYPDGRAGVEDDFSDIHKPTFGQGFSSKHMTANKPKSKGVTSTGKLPSLSF